MTGYRRREFLKLSASACASGTLAPALAVSAPDIIERRIARSDERVPVIGMGSWLTFDVGDSAHARGKRVEVLAKFFEMGGTVIDSSPMYGTSQLVIGHCLAELTAQHKKRQAPPVFAATKVWTPGRGFGIRQMNNSADLWGVERFDLMQIHNLLDWRTHIETLKEWKAAGKVRYLGVTTSHGRRHDDLEDLMRTEALDFIQLTYNIVDREAERRLLPMALERGVSVIVNRPFQRSLLFDRVRERPLPKWAAEFDCASWAEFLLKFIASHRAVTCVIPATSRLDHMTENMGALRGRLPDPRMRKKMAAYYSAL